MQTISGKLTLLGNASRTSSHVTYSTIEIDKRNINNISIGSGLDNYLSNSLGKECTLYINNKSIIGVDTNGKNYVVDAPIGSMFTMTFISVFFSLIFFALALMNFADGVSKRQIDGANIMAGIFFLALLIFAGRSALKNFQAGSSLRKVSKRENVIKV